MVDRNVVVHSWEDQESKSACTYDNDDNDGGGGRDGVAVRIKITCTGLSQRACASSPPRKALIWQNDCQQVGGMVISRRFTCTEMEKGF